jgi:branched-subunit amino acid transport protein
MSALEGIVLVVGMALITLLTRGAFMFSREEVPLPGWLRQGLRHAPLAALAAIVVPEIVMTQGQLISTLKDARLPAVVAASAWYFWRRDILGTIISGTAVLLALKLGLGW